MNIIPYRFLYLAFIFLYDGSQSPVKFEVVAIMNWMRPFLRILSFFLIILSAEIFRSFMLPRSSNDVFGYVIWEFWWLWGVVGIPGSSYYECVWLNCQQEGQVSYLHLSIHHLIINANVFHFYLSDDLCTEFWTYVEKSFTWSDLPSKFPTKYVQFPVSWVSFSLFIFNT